MYSSIIFQNIQKIQQHTLQTSKRINRYVYHHFSEPLNTTSNNATPQQHASVSHKKAQLQHSYRVVQAWIMLVVFRAIFTTYKAPHHFLLFIACHRGKYELPYIYHLLFEWKSHRIPLCLYIYWEFKIDVLHLKIMPQKFIIVKNWHF